MLFYIQLNEKPTYIVGFMGKGEATWTIVSSLRKNIPSTDECAAVEDFFDTQKEYQHKLYNIVYRIRRIYNERQEIPL